MEEEKTEIKKEDFKLFLESLEMLASKDKSDPDFELMKKAVSGIWSNLTKD